MNNREQLIKLINDEFVHWQLRLENLGSLNLYDAHTISEDSICKLLNLIFDYKLKNLNSLKMNFPAVDLGDSLNSVCFQVTSEKSSRKIQATIDKFKAFNLQSQYEDLFVIILGTKQRTYKDFRLHEDLNFTSQSNILDFRDILKRIRSYPMTKLEAILKVLTNESNVRKGARRKLSNSARVKRNLRIKKKLEKDFLRILKVDDWALSSYEPQIKFNFHEVLIRSVDDTMWPEVDTNRPSGISSWFKAELHDFYHNGIELIGMPGQAIFDKNGNWDILNWKGDDRMDKKEYNVVFYYEFLRIPYDFIEFQDMDTDPFYGLPSIYVSYANDNTPFECIVRGVLGNCKTKKFHQKFDLDKRKKLP